MVRLCTGSWLVRSVFVWVMFALSGYAQTNPPSVVSARETPVVEVADADAHRFFEKYREAVLLVREGHLQSAAITMDLLSHTIHGSPWLDIALLKHAQLNETANDHAAEDNYTDRKSTRLNSSH